MHATIHFGRSPFTLPALSGRNATQQALGAWPFYGPGLVQLVSAVQGMLHAWM